MSYIVLPSAKVIEMAQNTIEWIKDKRNVRMNKFVSDYRNNIVNGFWHKFFGCQDPTVEEVYEELKRKVKNPTFQ